MIRSLFHFALFSAALATAACDVSPDAAPAGRAGEPTPLPGGERRPGHEPASGAGDVERKASALSSGPQQYTVHVYIPIVDRAGSNATITLKAWGLDPAGNRVELGPWNLDDSANNFEPGRHDFFHLWGPRAVSIDLIALENDGTGERPDLYVGALDVSSGGKTYAAPLNLGSQNGIWIGERGKGKGTKYFVLLEDGSWTTDGFWPDELHLTQGRGPVRNGGSTPGSSGLAAIMTTSTTTISQCGSVKFSLDGGPELEVWGRDAGSAGPGLKKCEHRAFWAVDGNHTICGLKDGIPRCLGVHVPAGTTPDPFSLD